MRIKKVHLKNFKGVTKSYDLGDLSLIVGSNRAGKTTILDAVRLCLLGYHPKLGKKPSSLFSLSSGDEMSCSIFLEDGRSAEYSLTSTGGKISKQWNSLGDSINDNISIQFDPSVYFQATSREKKRKVFATITNTDDLATKIRAKIRSVPSEGTDAETAVFKDVDNLVSEHLDNSDLPNEQIDELINSLNERITNSRNHETRMQKMLEGLAQYSEPLNPLARTPEYYENAIKPIREKRDKLSGMVKIKRHVVDTITKYQCELEAIAESKGNTIDFSRISLLERSLSEMKTAYELRLNELLLKEERLKDKLRKAENLITEEDKTYEQVLEELCDGNYKMELEVFVKDKEVSTCVWKVEDFYTQDIATELKEVDAEIQTLESVYIEETTKTKDELNSLHRQREQAEDTKTEDFLMEQLQLRKDELKDIKCPDDAEDEIATMDAEIERLSRKAKEATMSVVDVQKVNDAKEALADAELEKNMYMSIRKAVNEFADDLNDKTMKNLLAGMNRFASGLDLPDYAISNGSVGYYKNNCFVSIDTFSGFETAIARTALAISLAMNSDCKISLIDELGRFDETSKRKTFLLLREMIDKGELNQFIGIDVISPLSFQDLTLIQV